MFNKALRSESGCTAVVEHRITLRPIAGVTGQANGDCPDFYSVLKPIAGLLSTGHHHVDAAVEGTILTV